MSYSATRDRLTTYFDKTAADAWRALTSEEKVSRIRATVRAGRDEMRAAILALLPSDLEGVRLYDAGCGTGALSVAAAQAGASVLAVDVSPTMIEIARERTDRSVPEATQADAGQIDFRAGDMLTALEETVAHAVAMDSLIHYRLEDVVAALTHLAPQVSRSIVFTFAPRTPLLAAMHTVGGLFPRGDKAPAIVPIAERRLVAALRAEPALSPFAIGRTVRISRGFYTSQALQLVRR
ncbi:MAG: magnesium protoporphyrin IX methyltransferase [Pseudomonadota bacterium]